MPDISDMLGCKGLLPQGVVNLNLTNLKNILYPDIEHKVQPYFYLSFSKLKKFSLSVPEYGEYGY